MSPQPRASTDSTSGDKAARQTVSIPGEAVTKLDALITRTATALKATAGVAVTLTRAQMVESLIHQAHDAKPEDETPEA